MIDDGSLLTVLVLFLACAVVVEWAPATKRGKAARQFAVAAGAAFGAAGLAYARALPDALWTPSLWLILYPALALVCAYVPWEIFESHRTRFELSRPKWSYILFALGQQTLLVAFLLPAVGPWWAAAIFGALHLPNPALSALTALAGLGTCLIAGPLGVPAILVAWPCHVVASTLFDGLLDARITGRMRVGRDYLELWRSW